ncbi:hypothetical protein ABZT27_15335 [Streptomyces sp. NPDC005389]|uniref:hypothetical protein n=1 Tax=Streptomyces sp. NPDC005389 TaxID=3157040 RepID=UPI0033A49B4F
MPAGRFTDGFDPFLAADGDDVGGTELAAEVGTCLVSAHEDGLLRAEPLGRERGQEADVAIADHSDASAFVDTSGYGGAVAGAEDVREGEHGRDEVGVRRDGQLDQGAVGERDADRFGVAALFRLAVPEAGPAASTTPINPCPAGRGRPRASSSCRGAGRCRTQGAVIRTRRVGRVLAARVRDVLDGRQDRVGAGAEEAEKR